MDRDRQQQDKNQPDNPSELLLEWHLNLLNADASAWVEAELHRDAKLRAQSQQLGRILRPLDHWSVGPGPSNLAENILNAVRNSAPAPWQVVPDPVGEPAVGRSFPFFRLRDMLAVAACVAVLLGAFIPGASALRSRSQRVLCASNMHGIAEGLSSYQASYAGALPFAGFARDAAWLPGGDPTCFASNSRHVFLLLKHRFVSDSKMFVCPSSKNAAPMDLGGEADCGDFAAARNISYDSLNLAGPAPNLRPEAAIAYISDPNPLFIGARFHGDVDPQRANSPAHGGCGQTVLTLDGRADYFRSPVYGANKDNLWMIEGVRRYTGTETPTRPDDAFLVPGFPGGLADAKSNRH